MRNSRVRTVSAVALSCALGIGIAGYDQTTEAFAAEAMSSTTLSSAIPRSPLGAAVDYLASVAADNVWIHPAKGVSNLQISFSYAPNDANYCITPGQTWDGIQTFQSARDSARIQVTAGGKDGVLPRQFFQDWSYAGGAAPNKFDAVGGGPGSGIPSEFNYAYVGTLIIKNTQTKVTSSYPVVMGQSGTSLFHETWYLGGTGQTFNFDYGRGILYTTDGLYKITSANDNPPFTSVDTFFVAPA